MMAKSLRPAQQISSSSQDLHSRSRVRVKACTSCKSLEQPGFYSLTWAYKIRFPGIGFPRIQKKKKKIHSFMCSMKYFFTNNITWLGLTDGKAESESFESASIFAFAFAGQTRSRSTLLHDCYHGSYQLHME